MENLRVIPASQQVFHYDATKDCSALLSTSQRAGYFLLKDGSKSFHTVYDQECGIFIDENLYIPLKLSKQKFTAHEAEIYYETMEQKIPDLYKIIRLQQALLYVNSSLSNVGLQDYCFSDNVLEDLWYEENLSQATKDTKRRCIIICEYGNYTRPEYQLLYNDYLLYKKTLVYHKEEGRYHPQALTLYLTISGVDILFADNAAFFRTKDGVLHYFLVDGKSKISVERQDLIRCGNVLYQACEQGLLKVADVHPDNLHNYTYIGTSLDADFEIVEDSDWTQESDVIASYHKVKKYRKNEEGIYTEISSETQTTYPQE